LAEDLVEALARRQILGEVADLIEGPGEVAEVERREVPTRHADRVDEVLGAAGEHLEEQQILRGRQRNAAPEQRLSLGPLATASSNGSDAMMTSSWKWPRAKRSVPVVARRSDSSSPTSNPAAVAAAINRSAWSGSTNATTSISRVIRGSPTTATASPPMSR
jgi:hypothetical protein